ncbi:hypothetical protein AMTRI_Chr03g46990 [Amborella trichopoda]
MAAAHRSGETLLKSSAKLLYQRLLKQGSSERSVGKELNSWIKVPKKRTRKWDAALSVKELRKRKRYTQALRLSETMARNGMSPTSGDDAIRIDLISKTRGIASAEKYFMDRPVPAKSHLAYGALLNCYCKENLTEKAEALMMKMKELGFVHSPLSYNSLMTLYMNSGDPVKIPSIIQEMKANNITPDTFTYNIWMRSLAEVHDIDGVERVLSEMKRDGRVSEDWTTFSNLASIYAKVGLHEKAEAALKEVEKKNGFRDLVAFQFLITLYGQTGNLAEVYRIWRSLKLAFPKTANISYLNMTQVLVKLGDLPGAEKCFREWEASCSVYDIRVANAMIDAYLKAGLLEKAKDVQIRAKRRGAKPNLKTHEIFIEYYLREGKIVLVLEHIEKAVLVAQRSGREWKPGHDVACEIMAYFEWQKDVDRAEGFCTILRKLGTVDAGVCEALLRTYVGAGKKDAKMGLRLRAEGVEVNSEMEKLLQLVCM